MFGLVKVAIGGLTSGVAGRWEGEAKFSELDRLIPVYVAHFHQRLRASRCLTARRPAGRRRLARGSRQYTVALGRQRNEALQ